MNSRSPKSFKQRLLASVAVLGALGAAMASCGGDDDSEQTSSTSAPTGTAEANATQGSFSDGIVDAARAEGSVVFYTSTSGGGPERLAEAFESEYPGIEVEIVHATPPEMVGRLSSEKEAGQLGADVVVQHDANLQQTFSSEGVWAPIESPQVHDERWTPFVKNDYIYAGVRVWGLAFNPDGIDEAPKEWSDMASEALKGRLGLTDYSGIDVVTVWYHTVNKELGGNFLKDVARAAEPRFLPSETVMREQLIAGDLLAFAIGTSAVKEAKREGAPIDIVFPEPVVGAPTFAAINSDAEHPNAAQLFMDFLMSEGGQAAYVTDDVSLAYGDSDIAVIDLTEYSREELDEMKAELNMIFGR